MTARETLMKHVGGRSRTAPIHDHIKGRRSEMDYITGLVSRKGRELGIPTPANDASTSSDAPIARCRSAVGGSNPARSKRCSPRSPRSPRQWSSFTVIASPRILIPILELYQNADGTVTIPQALRPYMGGRERIEKQ